MRTDVRSEEFHPWNVSRTCGVISGTLLYIGIGYTVWPRLKEWTTYVVVEQWQLTFFARLFALLAQVSYIVGLLTLVLCVLGLLNRLIRLPGIIRRYLKERIRRERLKWYDQFLSYFSPWAWLVSLSVSIALLTGLIYLELDTFTPVAKAVGGYILVVIFCTGLWFAVVSLTGCGLLITRILESVVGKKN